jgi:hypothetical protein
VPAKPQAPLNLLTREGAVAVTFATRLSDKQYAKLYDKVRGCETRQELRDSIVMVANEWGVKAIVDEG